MCLALPVLRGGAGNTVAVLGEEWHCIWTDALQGLIVELTVDASDTQLSGWVPDSWCFAAYALARQVGKGSVGGTHTAHYFGVKHQSLRANHEGCVRRTLVKLLDFDGEGENDEGCDGNQCAGSRRKAHSI